MSVPLSDHAKFYREHQREIDSAIRGVLRSGRFDTGPEVPAFESEFADWVGASHAIGVGSGTAALISALLALEVGSGDEVITVANNDIAGASSIRFVDADIVWVDIARDTKCMDTGACEAAITPRTRAIIAVDMYGHPAEMTELRRIADRHGLRLIEDACIAVGAEIQGRRVGSFADVTCFSFAPGKILSAYGGAGACTVEDPELAERIRMLSAYGQNPNTRRSRQNDLEFLFESDGLNTRLDEIQAAILRVKLQLLEENLRVRRDQASVYTERLRGLVDTPIERPNYRHAWRNYTIESSRRDEISDHLIAQGIGCAMLYAPPLHLQPVNSGLEYATGSLPETERSGERLLCLPIGPHLTESQVDSVVHAVQSALQ